MHTPFVTGSSFTFTLDYISHPVIPSLEFLLSRYLSLPQIRQDLTQGQWHEGRLLWGFRRGDYDAAGLRCSSLTWRCHSRSRGPYGLKSAFVGLCPYQRANLKFIWASLFTTFFFDLYNLVVFTGVWVRPSLINSPEPLYVLLLIAEVLWSGRL